MRIASLSFVVSLVYFFPMMAFAQGLAITPNPPPPTALPAPGLSGSRPPINPATGLPNVLNFPHDFPHAVHPWYGVFDPKRVNTGSVVGYIEVPPQQVVVDVYVPGPGSFSGGFEPQLFEIPGYVVTETTTGYVYPARVGLRQLTPGVFNWVTEPPVFQAK